METIRLKTEIYILKCYQTFHVILVILVIMCHFIAHTKYLFIYKSLMIGFGFGVALNIIIFFYILIANIIIFSKKYTPTLLNKLFIYTKTIAVICIIKGITLSLVYWLNYPNYPSFIENCPFNFTPEKMNELILNTKSDKLKQKCQLKRCFFIKEYLSDLNNNNNTEKDEINIKYDYICNFNIYKSYLNLDNSTEKCTYTYLYEIYNTVNYQDLLYFTKCDEFSNYYICTSSEKRHDKFKMRNDLRCPTKFKRYRIIILGILFPLIDIMADFSIIIFIYCQYKIIIKIINLERILGERFRYSASSLNSTKDCSIIINNGNNNRNLLPQLNLNQTEVYISQRLLQNNNDINTKDKNEKIVFNNTNKIELSESKNELINSKNELLSLNINNVKDPQNNG